MAGVCVFPALCGRRSLRKSKTPSWMLASGTFPARQAHVSFQCCAGPAEEQLQSLIASRATGVHPLWKSVDLSISPSGHTSPMSVFFFKHMNAKVHASMNAGVYACAHVSVHACLYAAPHCHLRRCCTTGAHHCVRLAPRVCQRVVWLRSRADELLPRRTSILCA